MRRVLLATVMVLAAACSGGTGPSSSKQFDERAFRDARTRWRAANITDYTVESRHSCFCPPHLVFWTRLTVSDSKIVAAEPLAPLPAGSPQLLGWRTVSEIFEAIESAAGDQDDMVIRITADYDPVLGYPHEVSIECRDTIADCGRSLYLRALTR